MDLVNLGEYAFRGKLGLRNRSIVIEKLKGSCLLQLRNLMRFALLSAILCIAGSAYAAPPEPSSSDIPNSTPDVVSEPSADIVERHHDDQTVRNTGISISPTPFHDDRVKHSKNELCKTAAAIAVENNLPVSFFANLIQQESGFQSRVVSRAGAQGIAQFMPRVAASFGLVDPFEPIAALAASGKLLAKLVAEFGNLGLAAAAYNAGPKRVQDWMAKRRRLPAETVHYVLNITGRSAEQWANRGTIETKLDLPSHARCLDNSGVAAQDLKLTIPPKVAQISSVGQLEAGTKPNSARRLILRRSMPQPSEFAIGLPVSRFASKPQRSSHLKLAPRHEPIMARFIAMATPTIMVEQSTPKRRKDGRAELEFKLSPLKLVSKNRQRDERMRMAAAR